MKKSEHDSAPRKTRSAPPTQAGSQPARKVTRKYSGKLGKLRKRGKQVPPSPARGQTDWAKVDALTDEDIDRAIAADPDAPPIFTDEMFARATWTTPAKRTPISLRVDPDVLAFYKQKGPGYQSRMNAVLRAFMQQERKRHR